MQLSRHYYAMMSGLSACGGSFFGKMISYSGSEAVIECSMFQLFVLCARCGDAILRIFSFVSLGRQTKFVEFAGLSVFKVTSCQLKHRNVPSDGLADWAEHQIGKHRRVFGWKLKILRKKIFADFNCQKKSLSLRSQRSQLQELRLRWPRLAGCVERVRRAGDGLQEEMASPSIVPFSIPQVEQGWAQK